MKINLDQIVSFCGLVCLACPIYWATWEEDEEKKKRMKEEIARQCNEQFETEFGIEDISDCDGCKTKEGRLFSDSNKCEIRRCALLKGLENCAHCQEYPCERLEQIFATDPSAKSRLDVIKSQLD